jgi:hypothetical protein
VLSQLCLMSRLHDALSVVDRTRAPRHAAEHRRIADRLLQIAELLQPGSGRRDDRPGGDAEPPVAAPAARKKAARKASPVARKRAPAKARKTAAKKAPAKPRR